MTRQYCIDGSKVVVRCTTIMVGIPFNHNNARMHLQNYCVVRVTKSSCRNEWTSISRESISIKRIYIKSTGWYILNVLSVTEEEHTHCLDMLKDDVQCDGVSTLHKCCWRSIIFLSMLVKKQPNQMKMLGSCF